MATRISSRMSSALGILNLLKENDVELQTYALRKLNLVAHQCWHEMANYLADLYRLFTFCAPLNPPL